MSYVRARGLLLLATMSVSLNACAANNGIAPSANLNVRSQSVSAGELVYVSDFLNDRILAFPAGESAKNPPPVETIELNVIPKGLWIDRNDILYVAAGRSVLEFTPGSRSPFRRITDGVVSAESVAVDTSGTLYVGNDDNQQVLVGEYPAGASKPSLKVTISIPGSIRAFAGGMTFDSAGNLYIGAFFYQKARGHVFRVARGTTTYTDLGLSAVGGDDGLAMDRAGNLYAGDGGTIYVYAPGVKTPWRKIAGSSEQPSLFALTRAGALYVPITGSSASNSMLEEFAPGGSTPINILSGHFQEPVGAGLRSEAF